MSATLDCADELRVTFELTTEKRVERWLERELLALGISLRELDEQARDGCFQSDRARRVWIASPSGQLRA